ncbi:PAS domain-containing protein [Falsigemmobacter faecalis]|uniref:PAS domain-containing protein n=1 Tax=Falsigemmobacter faecalis TaxID=2488730 RepID=A0A3P3DKS9_9RHOB|nr:PAS domain-containing protein [Falsigemmobacter faecalis]RRH74771.1 PAS domain-containing protein [Falsigemmobacter faecalis]
MRGFTGRSGQTFTLLQGGAPVPRAGAFAQTEAYWLALRGEGRLLPERCRFDPRGVADILNNLMLLERIAPGQVRVRLAGQSVGDLFGLSPEGMPLTALISPESRGAVAARLEEVFRRPAVLEMDLSAPAGLLRPTVQTRLLVLPMTGRDGACDRALACMISDAPPAGRVLRFGLDQVRLREIPQPERGVIPAHPPQAKAAEFQEIRAARPAAAAHPHLRLVKS